MGKDLERSKASLVEEVGALRKRVNILEQLAEQHANGQKLQSALYRIADTTSSAQDMLSFYKTLHDIINSLTVAKNCFIAVLDRERKNVYFPYYIDEHYTRNPDELIPIEEFTSTLTGIIFRTGEVLHADNAGLAELNRSGEANVRGLTAQDWLGVPLKHEGKILGALVIQSYERGFLYGQQDEDLLVYVSRHIATALHRKQADEELRATHDGLRLANRRLEQRAREISTANLKLEAMLEERRSIQEKLIYDALHDVLTDLPNRALFLNRLEQALKRSKSRGEVEFAVFFLDLDRFKIINDSLGHLVGDALLQQTSRRLLDCIRPGDTLARFGGDEFCMLLDNISTQQQAIKIADRILQKFTAPFILDAQEVFTSTSIGITLSPMGYEEPEAILRDADAAMYQAKSQGKARYQVFDKGMYEQAMTRLQLESDLRQAIGNGELVVYYQPIISLASGKITSFEALARWQHRTLGFVAPMDFIGIAEETGYINELGAYILEQAMTQTNRWRSRIAAARDLQINVNISGYQIKHQGLLETIRACARRSRLPINHLKLEITETVLLNNMDAAKSLLSEVSNMQVQLVLDDFGTGYSSLGYLHQFPLSALKIDLSFIKSIDKNQRNRAIVRTIQALASSLALEVVAEGVETEAQYNIVKDLNIGYAQGYYLGMPMPPEDAERLLVDQVQ